MQMCWAVDPSRCLSMVEVNGMVVRMHKDKSYVVYECWMCITMYHYRLGYCSGLLSCCVTVVY